MAAHKIICKSTIAGTAAPTHDATPIQIEDWREVYPDLAWMSYIVAIYPIARSDYGTPFGPQRNKRFRLEFNFADGREAVDAYRELSSGNRSPEYYRSHADRPEYLPLIK